MSNNISIKQPSAISFSITPKCLYILAVFLFLTVVLGYVSIKFIPFLFAPEIALRDLSGETIIVNSPRILIGGGVKNTHSLTLNGEELYIGKNGEFQGILRLDEGINILSLEAKNIFGRSREVVARIVYIKS